MKTKNLMMVMAALAMAGCSQNEVTEVNPEAHPVIGFDVYTGVQTRGAETDLAALKVSDAGFGFFAYKTEGAWNDKSSTATPNFLYNEQGTWKAEGSSGSWKYTHIRFWPTNEDKITFFAYAPYESRPEDGNTKGIVLSKQTDMGAPTIIFEVNDTWKNMVDLVTDARPKIKDLTSQDKMVSFKFSHVLTKIADIKVKPNTDLGDETKIFVTGLKLDAGSNQLYKKAIYKFDDDSWTQTSTPDYFTGEQNLSSFLNSTAASFWGYNKESVNVSNSTDATSLFKTDEALYFIPVNNGNGTSTAGDLKLKISYDIVTKNGESHLISSVTDKEISLPAGTFKKGTAHTYTLTIQLNTIDIAVDDSNIDWGTPENSDSENMNVK